MSNKAFNSKKIANKIIDIFYVTFEFICVISYCWLCLYSALRCEYIIRNRFFIEKLHHFFMSFFMIYTTIFGS